MSETSNYNLYITDDQTVLFPQWTSNVAGATNSNMTKIDAAIKAASDAAAAKIPTSEKGAANGVATLGSNGKVPAGQLPDLNYIPVTQKGTASGVAELDENGLVPSGQLPSYVDDVIDSYIVSGATELSTSWLSKTNGGAALTPESGKIYIIVTEGEYYNLQYRWSGTVYANIGTKLVIGTGANNAAAGNHVHGNITNDGKVGSASGKVLVTGTGGAVQAETEASGFNKEFEGTAKNIQMDGTASAGTSVKIARADHVHPSDTSKQNTINASGILKGTGGGTVTSAIAGIDYANVSAILSGTLSTTWLGDSAPYSQVVTVTNMTASANGVAGLSSTATNAQISAASAALLFVSAQATDSITVVAYGIKPKIEIPLQFLIVG